MYFYTCREIYATIMEAADFCETLVTKEQSHILEHSNRDKREHVTACNQESK